MSGMLSRKFLLACVLLAWSSVGTAFAQNANTISGTVTDSSGAVVVGATVRALDLATNREVTVQTDGGGKFSIPNLRAGTYRVSATGQGFTTDARNILVEDGAAATADFSLAPGAIEDTVTVTAGKGSAIVASEVPQTVTVISEEDLERQRPRSTFEAIERAPNIIVRETNPARERPRLRGLDSSRVLIVIDGEKLNNARTDLQTGLSPSIIDVTQLESAEVVAGAGSSLYGSDSLAGTINLITKGPNRPDKGLLLGFRFDGNYSSNGRVRRGNAVMNLSNKEFAFRLGGLMFRNDNYKIGDTPITLAETLAVGRFYTTIPTSVPGANPVNSSCFPIQNFSCNTANGFPIFSVPAGGEILNGQGHGANIQADMWWFPTENHNFRFRYIDSRHKNLGDAFSGPPYETQERFNPFRSFDKFGLRYEALDLVRWLPRVSVNFYRQKLSFPQAQNDYTNLNGGSYLNQTAPLPPAFTGNPSVFRVNSFTNNKNTITTENVDVQAILSPFAGLLVTIGGQILQDSSRDEFIAYPYLNGSLSQPNIGAAQCGTFAANRTCGASSPNTKYQDRAAFVLAEFDRIKWFRLTGSLRWDNWKTTATPSDAFPLGLEFGVLTTALPILQANPGSLAGQVSSVPDLIRLANRTGEVKSDKKTLTGTIGGVLRLPFGINPYIRYGTSYREPSITERYIIRNFNTGIPGFYALVVGNPGLEPETGKSFDVGVKAQGKRYNGSFGYFRNNLSNLIIFQSPDFGNICATPAPGLPGLPFPFLGCAPGRALINFNGRINQADNEIHGFEGTGEVSVPLGKLGSVNPFVSFGTLYGTNKSPTPVQLFIIDRVFNRADTPFPLEGSREDVPLGNITPLRVIGGASFTDASGRFFAEYSFRHQARVKRVNPTFINGTTLVNYGTAASLNSFTRHDIKAGYSWRTERYRMSLNAGIANLTDKLYWEHFQNAPAPGRSYIFGFTTEIFNVLKW
jgi:outer membrane receptor protein involved in Fe transport